MTAANESRRAIVIGGSLAGLFCANLLWRAGWDVHVYERVAQELASRGAGIVTHPELLQALERAGVKVDSSLGVEVFERVTFSTDGEILGRLPLRQLMTGWSRLYQLLRKAFPSERYHPGRALVAIEQEASRVTARMADGGTVTGDLLIGADGIRSTVRSIFLPGVKPTYVGYAAWRGLAEESAFSPSVRDQLFERFSFCLLPEEQILGYPIAGTGDRVEPGHRWFNFVWYRPADENGELRRLLTDDAGKFYPDGIAPNLVSGQVVNQMRADARRLLAPQFAEAVQLAPRPFIQPIFDLESPQIVFGRVVLVGDAAFIARPHTAMSVTKAAQDAIELVEALAGANSLTEALKLFNEKRTRYGRAIVAHGRRLGGYVGEQFRKRAENYGFSGLRRTPESVMREIAVPPSFATL